MGCGLTILLVIVFLPFKTASVKPILSLNIIFFIHVVTSLPAQTRTQIHRDFSPKYLFRSLDSHLVTNSLRAINSESVPSILMTSLLFSSRPDLGKNQWSNVLEIRLVHRSFTISLSRNEINSCLSCSSVLAIVSFNLLRASIFTSIFITFSSFSFSLLSLSSLLA